jgi:hypothetical protein
VKFANNLDARRIFGLIPTASSSVIVATIVVALSFFRLLSGDKEVNPGLAHASPGNAALVCVSG